MSNKSTQNTIVIVLAVIGGIAILGLFAMWLMHATMMGGMMGGAVGVMRCCGGMMRVWLSGLLLIGAIIVAVLLFIRRRPRL